MIELPHSRPIRGKSTPKSMLLLDHRVYFGGSDTNFCSPIVDIRATANIPRTGCLPPVL